eukprot:TRINITY_DN1075_c0_g1_i4.p1 TRINITY_DN1075_c0_g1~~TRINITY_DN1075_c0_g1_i4.p1  ORF type:complete len:1030 (+),score=355.23 TRINITY_DN1075_c0_g1_i4:93-3092(+)
MAPPRTWVPKRSRRYRPHGERYRYYLKGAFRRWIMFVGVIGVAVLAQQVEWLGASVTAQAPDAPSYRLCAPTTDNLTTPICTPPRLISESDAIAKKIGSFKKMNYPYFRDGKERYTQAYETTGELLEYFLDDNGKRYKEHRWALTGGRDGGIDYIVRYPPDWTFCYSYILFPGENMWWQELRAFLYLITLLYVFLGVAIVADVFMSSIEKITSEKPVLDSEGRQMLDPDGSPVMVKTWNDTVANLTLLALGSSAPEILLSLLETLGSFDQAPGELGPSTIVGSAAFNLLCITGVCMYATSSVMEEAKKIKEYGVFCITAFFSIFAYIWVLVVLQFNTPDVVDMWEAFMTLAFFPILVILSYCQDRNWFRGSESSRVAPSGTRQSTASIAIDDTLQQEINAAAVMQKRGESEIVDEDAIASSLAEKHRPKLNHGHYRCNATRIMTAKQPVLGTGGYGSGHASPGTPRAGKQCGTVQFRYPAYVCSEGDGHIDIAVVREGACAGEVTAKYLTQDLTAKRGVHYQPATGELKWADGEEGIKTFKIQVIDDTKQNADRTLTAYIEVSPPEAAGATSHAVITIEDDDLHGEVSFDEPFLTVSESAGVVKLPVVRNNGTNGGLQVRYHTEDGDHQAGGAEDPKDYVGVKAGVLEFMHGEKTKFIEIQIVDDFDYSEKLEHFFCQLDGVELMSARRKSVAEEPTVPPALGRLTRMRVDITNDTLHHAMVDRIKEKVIAGIDVNSKIWSGSWGQQFRDAFTIGGDEDQLSPMHYVMHFLTMLWKVIFATIPPPDYAGGWACFGVALAYIGMVTKMVEEVATLLGCSMGLKKPVTAITFVALGTSLPDTFASKQATEEEEYADAAIGNVTGSNGVNVFLGLGLPWVVASCYYTAKDVCFILPAGDLAFSVLVFAICGCLCLGALFFLRLCHPQHAELGGPLRVPMTIFMVTLWIVYVMLSALQVYHDFAGGLKTKACPWSCMDGKKPNAAIIEEYNSIFPFNCNPPSP